MRRIFCTIAILGCALFLGAQLNINVVLPQTLVAAQNAFQAKNYDKALSLADSYLAEPNREEIPTAVAHYIKGQTAYNINNKDLARDELDASLAILTGIDEETLRKNPVCLGIISECCAFAYDIADYDKCVNYGNVFVYLSEPILKEHPELKNTVFDVAVIMSVACQKTGDDDSIINCVKYMSNFSPEGAQQIERYCQLCSFAAQSSLNLKRWDDSILLYNVTLAILENWPEAKKNYIFKVRMGLANALSNSGRTTDARDIYLSLLSWLDSDLIDDSYKATFIMDYSNNLFSLGENRQGLELITKYESFLSSTLSKENLAIIYQSMLVHQKEEGLTSAAAETQRKIDDLYNEDAQTGEDNNQLYYALSLLQKGEAESVGPILDRLKLHFEEKNDTLSQDYYTFTRSVLAYNIMTNKQVTPELAERMLSSGSYNYGKYHETHLTDLAAMKLIAFRQNNKADMSKYMNEYVNLVSGIISQRFIAMTKEQRETYWNSINSELCSIFPFIVTMANHEGCTAAGYQAALISKGLLLRSDIYMNELTGNGGTDKSYSGRMKECFDQLVDICKNPTEDMNEEALKVFAQFAKDSPLFAKMQERMEVKADDVIKALKPEDMAVEFVWVEKECDNPFLMAYLLRKGWTSPRMCTIMNQTDYDKIKSTDPYTLPLLSMAIWGKIKEYADGVKNVYFSPDGPLHQIAIEYLPDFEKPGVLISDRWKLHRLSSTRELAIKPEKSKNSGALFGGMLYDASADSISAEATLAQASGGDRSFEFVSDDIDDLGLRSGVNYLPQTLTEAENISGMFGRARIKHDKFTGTRASEDNFKASAGNGSSIVHIATHGFYWTKRDANKLKSLSFLHSDGTEETVSEEDMAMRRSGLLFSGANNTLTGRQKPTAQNDGILTALEISRLDLSKVNLLVLSACETGLGDVSGDGVFGLQRGFKKAGVNSILMSLWKVDDKATQMLMEKFYEGYLAGKPKKDALSAAQKYIREYEIEVAEETDDDSSMTASQRRKAARTGELEEPTASVTKRVRPYTDPKYWAAFILLDALD